MQLKPAFDEPSTVAAADGRVLMDGPGYVAVDLTPSAAEETARRLSAAAAEARRQPPLN